MEQMFIYGTFDCLGKRLLCALAFVVILPKSAANTTGIYKYMYDVHPAHGTESSEIQYFCVFITNYIKGTVVRDSDSNSQF
jgi:hypothetical protein